MSLKQKFKKACKSAPAQVLGHVSLDLVQIEFRLESVLDAIRFRLFLKSPAYKYVPYVIRKEERHHVCNQQLSAHRHP